jgi:glyoxylase-like metal-dependent hydrolase (beta-lactamase superfamily II)
MQVKAFFDQITCTLTYVVYDEATRDAVIIDPVLDFDPASGKLSTSSVDDVIGFVRSSGLTVHFILETHAHADHLSSSQILKTEFPKARVAIGAGIGKVQEVFKKMYALPDSFRTDGSQFDVLLQDEQHVSAGSLGFDVIFTPGHTPACATYDFDGTFFTGDALFMPDYGVGRTDFPGGSAEALFASVMRLYRFPDSTRVFAGHDYLPGGRPLRYESTIGEEKRANIQLNAATTREQFIKFRTERDATLAAPRLLHPSVQVNIAAGHVPPPEANGVPFVRIPLSGKIPG